MNYNNAKNIFIVFGLKRSGHHAITEWIRSSFEPPTVYYNNCFVLGELPHYSALNFSINENKYLPYYYKGLKPFRKKQEPVPLEDIPSDVNCLMWSYEDFDISKTSFRILDMMTSRFCNSCENQKVVMIIRDPFNNIASKLFGYKKLNSLMALQGEKFKEVWKAYARFFIENQNDDKFVCINYNKWVVDTEYRKEIFKKLGLDKFRDGCDKVPLCGHHSSFNNDKNTYKTDMNKFNERWQKITGFDYTEYFLKDQELVDLTKQIFGKELVYKIIQQEMTYGKTK